jgi:uncharacterized membrane protein
MKQHEHREQEQRGERLARGLALFSIGLGAAELMAPRAMARLAGLPQDSTDSLRLLGAREIGHGLGILSNPASAGWVWTRVGGDAVDLSVLAAALQSDDSDRARVASAIIAVLGVTALDIMCAGQLSTGRSGGTTTASPRGRTGAIRVEQVVTINRPIEEVYQFWRAFQNFPRFMRHLESVQVTSDRRSRWRAKGPAGITVEWEAEMIEDREAEWIAWRSLEGADVPNSGSVRFRRAPGARGTELRVQMEYSPPAGKLGRGVAWLFGADPEQQIREDLRRSKQLLETGEITLSEGPGLWRPAQPPRDPQQVRDLAGVHS